MSAGDFMIPQALSKFLGTLQTLFQALFMLMMVVVMIFWLTVHVPIMPNLMTEKICLETLAVMFE